MAKRVRGSRSTHRPGGQGPSRAKKSADDATLAPDEETPATASDEIVSDVSYDEVAVDETAVAALAAATTPPAAAKEVKETKRSRRRDRRQPKRRNDDLASRAAAENVWVREDLRRIGIVSLILLVALAVSWVVFGVLDVLSLY